VCEPLEPPDKSRFTELADRKLSERLVFNMAALGVAPSKGVAAENLTTQKGRERATEQSRFIFARYQTTVGMERDT
jgi:hypothetical protein